MPRALVAIFAVTVIVSAPAWTGSWIYDDWAMAQRNHVDDFGDLASVLQRTSADYMNASGEAPAGTTYRPLTMASLIVVHALSPTPLPHHLLSLLMHLATALLLYLTLQRLAGERTALLLTGTFALHPLTIEAYGWINGRSDLVLGIGVGLLTLGLAYPGKGRIAPVLIGTAVACLAKETGFPASLALLTAFLLPRRGLPTSAALRVRLAPFGLAVLTMLGCAAPRFFVAKMQGLGAPSLLSDLFSPGLQTRLCALAAESWFVPAPRAMLGLSFQLAQPLSWSRIVLLIALASVLLLALRRQHFRAAILMASALLLLSPCAVVRHAGMWLGFDRYLYVPTMFACLALADTDLTRGLDAMRERPLLWVVPGLLTVLGLSSFATAWHYHDQKRFIDAMTSLRPEDPTGPVYGATWMVTAELAAEQGELLSKLDASKMPASMAFLVAGRLEILGRRRDAIAVVTEVERREIRDPFVIRRLAHLRLLFGEVDAAAIHAQALRAEPRVFCDALVRFAEKQLSTGAFTDIAQRHKAEAFVAAPPCAP